MEFFKQLLSRDFLLAGAIKAITAAVSVVTVAMPIPLPPKVISLPGRIL
jgi:hypothetical protein